MKTLIRTNLLVCVCTITFVFIVLNLKDPFRHNVVKIYNKIAFRSAEDTKFTGKKRCSHSLHGKIPKIIHQTWNTEIVPTEFLNNIKSLVHDNPYPEWQYFWWTKQTMIQLVHDKYPQLLDIVNSTGTTAILRSDIMRYVLMHEFGGAYFDLDTKSVRPLNSFIDTHECALALEPGEHYFAHKTDFLITNSVMFCEPRNPFFRQMLELVRMNPGCTEAFICTGPPVITRAYLDMTEKSCQSCKLPEVVSSEVFQDWYDAKYQDIFMQVNCMNYSKLRDYQIQICKNWKKRGREKRKLSENAYTYHTWYHINGKNITLDDKNHISNIIPTAKIYGKHFSSSSSSKSYYLI